MFRLLLTADSNIETGVGDASVIIASNDFYKFMEVQEYGEDIKHLAILFICRDPELKFKQRIRYTKKDQALCIDLMLDYNQFVEMSMQQRISTMCEKVLEEIPSIVKKYKFSDFDLDKLINNFSYWFDEHDFIIDISDDLKLDCDKIGSEESISQEKRKSFFKRILLRK